MLIRGLLFLTLLSSVDAAPGPRFEDPRVITARATITSMPTIADAKLGITTSHAGHTVPTDIPIGGDYAYLQPEFQDFEPGGPINYGLYSVYCGQWATGRSDTAEDLAWGERENIPEEFLNVTVEKGKCYRTACYETTAIFLCNHSYNSSLTLDRWAVGWMADRIVRICCTCDYNGRFWPGESGEMFHPKHNYSVVVGYANCQLDENMRPYERGLGNNLECVGNPIPNGSTPRLKQEGVLGDDYFLH